MSQPFDATSTRRLSRRRLLRGGLLGGLGLAGAALIGCADDDEEPTPAPTPEATTATAEATAATPEATEAATAEATQAAQPVASAELFVLSNSSPHISVIDVESNQVTRTADIPDFTGWTWNDDHNYASGSELWLGTKHPDTNEVVVITLDMDTLEVTHSIPIGTDDLTLYLGQADSEGRLHVGKMGSAQVAVIDTASYELLATWDAPANGDVVCDADISVGADGVERVVYPTRNGDTVVALDPANGDTLSEVAVPGGTTPLMLTAGPDGRVWVQDSGSNTNSVFDPVDLSELARFPAGERPIVATFSPDGRLAYIGHGGDTIVQVIDTESYEEVQRITVGTNPQKLAVHPDGSRIYAILTMEGSVAVIDTASWEITERIMLGTNPTTPFMRTLA